MVEHEGEVDEPVGVLAAVAPHQVERVAADAPGRDELAHAPPGRRRAPSPRTG